MPAVIGLEKLRAYFGTKAESFIPYLLHNTYVVIDAPNLLWRVLLGNERMHYFGGEYQFLFGKISKYLRMLRDCDVNPILIFGGQHIDMVSSQMSKNNHDRSMENTLLIKYDFYVPSMEALSLTLLATVVILAECCY